jgi:hypothetical protein
MSKAEKHKYLFLAKLYQNTQSKLHNLSSPKATEKVAAEGGTWEGGTHTEVGSKGTSGPTRASMCICLSRVSKGKGRHGRAAAAAAACP